MPSSLTSISSGLSLTFTPSSPLPAFTKSNTAPTGVTYVTSDELALKIHALLDEKQVDWTSTVVIRIGSIEEPKEKNNVVLWIGVVPESLLYESGIDAALMCRLWD